MVIRGGDRSKLVQGYKIFCAPAGARAAGKLMAGGGDRGGSDLAPGGSELAPESAELRQVGKRLYQLFLSFACVCMLSGCGLVRPSQEPGMVPASALTVPDESVSPGEYGEPGRSEVYLGGNGEVVSYVDGLRVVLAPGTSAGDALALLSDALTDWDVLVKGEPAGSVWGALTVRDSAELGWLVRAIAPSCRVSTDPWVVDCEAAGGGGGPTLIGVWEGASVLLEAVASRNAVACEVIESFYVCRGESAALRGFRAELREVDSLRGAVSAARMVADGEVVSAVAGVIAPDADVVSVGGSVVVVGSVSDVERVRTAVEALDGGECAVIVVPLDGPPRERERYVGLLSEVVGSSLCGEVVVMRGAAVVRVRGDGATGALNRLGVLVRGGTGVLEIRVLVGDVGKALELGRRVYRIRYAGGDYDWHSGLTELIVTGSTVVSEGRAVAEQRESRQTGVKVSITGAVRGGVAVVGLRIQDTTAEGQGGQRGVVCEADLVIGGEWVELCGWAIEGLRWPDLFPAWAWIRNLEVDGNVGRYSVAVRYVADKT